MDLNSLALKYNTDKSSWGHYYTRYYEDNFSTIKDCKMKILEIGIANGAPSLKMWKDYFSNSKIYGIDNADFRIFSEKRIEIFVGDQTDISFLDKINNENGPFDIIIDDGSHYNPYTLITFEFLFPKLNSKGFYVIEDLHTSYWEGFGEPPFSERIKTLVDEINSYGKLEWANLSDKSLDFWEKSIEYMKLYRSLLFIRKK